MLIEIDESIPDSAIRGNSNSLLALVLIASSQAMGYHIVWAERKVLKLILSVSDLGQHNLNIYSTIYKKYATITSEYDKIKFRAVISNKTNTSNSVDRIIINPDEFPNFNYVNRTVLLAENLSDTDLFKHIATYYLRENNLNINIEFDKQLGGGDTTATEYEKYSKNKEIFCLCLLDGDRKYDAPNAPYGQTYKNVRTINDKFESFNCMYYGTERVLEIENLIPSSLYLSDSNYKNEQIIKDNLKFDLSFFDLKEGLKYKSLINLDILMYWKHILAHTSIINDINAAEKHINSNVDEFRKVHDKDVFIKGFGTKLLDTVLKKQETKLQSIKNEDLSPAQIAEWKTIGKYITNWCCVNKINKISL